MLVAEEQPVLACCACAVSFCQEGAEGRDAGSGADHDNILFRFGKSEQGVVVDIELDGLAGDKLRKVVGAKPMFLPGVDREGIKGYGKVDLAGVGFRGGGNGVQPGGGGLQDSDHFQKLAAILYRVDL